MANPRFEVFLYVMETMITWISPTYKLRVGSSGYVYREDES